MIKKLNFILAKCSTCEWRVLIVTHYVFSLWKLPNMLETMETNWKLRGSRRACMKPFVAFPVVLFINHFTPHESARNIEDNSSSIAWTHPPLSLPLSPTTDYIHHGALECVLSLLVTTILSLFREFVARRSPWKQILLRARWEEPALLLCGTWTNNSYYGVAVFAPQEISLPRAGIELRWRKVRKEVLRLARKEKIEGDKVHLAGPPSASNPFCPFPLRFLHHSVRPFHPSSRTLSPRNSPFSSAWRARQGAGEKGNSIFHG